MLNQNTLISSNIIGFILMILTTAVLFFIFSLYLKRIKKINMIRPENSYFNKKIHLLFVYYFFIGFIPMFLIITIIFSISLAIKSSIIAYVFAVCYLLYTIQLLIFIIFQSKKQYSIVAFEYEKQLILFDEVIKIDDILSVSHNLKRTVIFISFKDQNNLEDLIKIPYNWQLMDYLKSLNLKINN